MRELLEAPQWDDDGWWMQLQVQMSEAVNRTTMFRPWLESFATVQEMIDEGIVDGEPKMERFVLPDVKGKQVAWLAPGGSVDTAALTVGVFEPPAQWVSRSATIGLDKLKAVPAAAVAEMILAMAADLDDAFRRRVAALRVLGDVHVGIWSGLRTRGTTLDVDDGAAWQLQGKYLIAAAAIGPDASEDPAVEPPSDDLAAEIAETRAFVEERTATADEEPQREPYDEPAGDLREVEPDDVLDQREDFSGVGGMEGARRTT